MLDHDDELGPPPPPEVERPAGLRNVAVGTAVAGALVVGALLVGMGQSSSSAPTITSTAPPTTRRHAAGVRPATTTPGITFKQVRGRGPMLPESTGTVLYGLTQDGSLVRVDLDDGDVTWRNLQLSDAPSDHQLLARAGAVVVAPANRQRPRLVADTLTGRVHEAPFDGPILFGPAPDELWLLSGRGDGDVYAAAQRVKLDGTPVGAELALPPLFVLGSDGAGAPLLWGVSGTYLVDPATSAWERVSEQRLAGWGAAAFVDLGCDQGFPCHWRVHDRLTGADPPPSRTGARRGPADLRPRSGVARWPDGSPAWAGTARRSRWSISRPGRSGTSSPKRTASSAIWPGRPTGSGSSGSGPTRSPPGRWAVPTRWCSAASGRSPTSWPSPRRDRPSRPERPSLSRVRPDPLAAPDPSGLTGPVGRGEGVTGSLDAS